jgi:hypothetical protein
MKKTIDLLNEVVAMGFSKEEALESIDAALNHEAALKAGLSDGELCEIDIQKLRKPLKEEEIPEELYEDILNGFLCEMEGC